MATRKALKAINWAGITERLHEKDRAIYAAFKSKSDMYLRKVQEYPEKSPAIDWTYYQKNIQVPGLVDNFKKQYEAISIPYPKDTYTELVEAEAKSAEDNVKSFINETNKMITELEGKIKQVQGLLPFSQMTMEDVYDMYPEERFDPLNRPTIWPHGPEDQVDEERHEEH